MRGSSTKTFRQVLELPGRCTKTGDAMTDTNNDKPPKRQYPPFYEKVVPIALGILVVVVIILLFIILGVASGLLPGAR